MSMYVRKIKNGKSRRGAVALEYILIASLVAIALMGAFLYFRRTLDRGVTEMTNVAGQGMSESVETAKKELEGTGNAFDSKGQNARTK